LGDERLGPRMGEDDVDLGDLSKIRHISSLTIGRAPWELWPSGGLEIVFFRRLVDLDGFVAGELRLLDFLGVGLDDPLLHRLAGRGVDRMGDVGVELEAHVALGARGDAGEPVATNEAVLGAQVVLAAAAGAALADLAGGHRDEGALLALDDLEVADDEGVVEGDGAERPELVAPPADQLDPDFRDLHAPSRVMTPAGATKPANSRRTRCARRRASAPDAQRPYNADPDPVIRAPYGSSAASLVLRTASSGWSAKAG